MKKTIGLMSLAIFIVFFIPTALADPFYSETNGVSNPMNIFDSDYSTYAYFSLFYDEWTVVSGAYLNDTRDLRKAPLGNDVEDEVLFMSYNGDYSHFNWAVITFSGIQNLPENITNATLELFDCYVRSEAPYNGNINTTVWAYDNDNWTTVPTTSLGAKLDYNMTTQTTVRFNVTDYVISKQDNSSDMVTFVLGNPNGQNGFRGCDSRRGDKPPLLIINYDSINATYVQSSISWYDYIGSNTTYMFNVSATPLAVTNPYNFLMLSGYNGSEWINITKMNFNSTSIINSTITISDAQDYTNASGHILLKNEWWCNSAVSGQCESADARIYEIWFEPTLPITPTLTFMQENPEFLIIPIALVLVSLSLLATSIIGNRIDISRLVIAVVAMVMAITIIGVMFVI